MRFLRMGPLSHEHIWAEWIQTYVSRAFSKRMHTASFSGTLHAERIWNGDMLTDTIPCVCERCNSGWMSRLQTRAKPHIVPFLQATWPTLDRWASRSGGMDHHVHNGLRIPRPPYSGDPFQAA